MHENGGNSLDKGCMNTYYIVSIDQYISFSGREAYGFEPCRSGEHQAHP